MNEVTSAADSLDAETRSAVTKLVDIKVESDMEKALTIIRSEFSLLKAELVHVESKFATVYWVIGLVVGLSTALLAIIISLKH